MFGYIHRGPSIPKARYGIVGLDIGNRYFNEPVRIHSLTFMSRQKTFPSLVPETLAYPEYTINKIPSTFVAFHMENLPKFLKNKDIKLFIKEEDDYLNQHRSYQIMTSLSGEFLEFRKIVSPTLSVNHG